mmetsp:Transcript_8665/g.20936  ORF Transcript_8665/g.20936 Transcript_8665/m.20936 type:complete len:235 (+) Transcript_8665:949-1653(+)
MWIQDDPVYGDAVAGVQHDSVRVAQQLKRDRFHPFAPASRSRENPHLILHITSIAVLDLSPSTLSRISQSSPDSRRPAIVFLHQPLQHRDRAHLAAHLQVLPTQQHRDQRRGRFEEVRRRSRAVHPEQRGGQDRHQQHKNRVPVGDEAGDRHEHVHVRGLVLPRLPRAFVEPPPEDELHRGGERDEQQRLEVQAGDNGGLLEDPEELAVSVLVGKHEHQEQHRNAEGQRAEAVL